MSLGSDIFITGATGPRGTRGTIGATGASGAVGSWTIRNSDYFAVSGDRIIADTSAGSFTLKLPAFSVNGDLIQILDGADFALNNLMVSGQGNKIEDIFDNVEIDVKGSKLDFTFISGSWQITINSGI
jgi:hypothetical protein